MTSSLLADVLALLPGWSVINPLEAGLNARGKFSFDGMQYRRDKVNGYSTDMLTDKIKRMAK
jgi:hypothetical protein